MTARLSQAFNKAAELPETVQEEITQQLLEDIEAELNWDQTFARCSDQVAELADKALQDIKAKRVKKMGIDAL